MNPKKFLMELKRRNISESRDRKRARDAYQHRTQDSNLHVAHEEGDALWITYFFQRLQYVEAMDPFS